MGHAMRGAECVQHPSAAHAMPGAQRVGRIIEPGVDHLAVARGDAVGDPTGHFGDGHLMTGLRRSARDGKPDDASADHQNLNRGSSLESIAAGVVDSGHSLRWGAQLLYRNRPNLGAMADNIARVCAKAEIAPDSVKAF